MTTNYCFNALRKVPYDVHGRSVVESGLRAPRRGVKLQGDRGRGSRCSLGTRRSFNDLEEEIDGRSEIATVSNYDVCQFSAEDEFSARDYGGRTSVDATTLR